MIRKLSASTMHCCTVVWTWVSLTRPRKYICVHFDVMLQSSAHFLMWVFLLCFTRSLFSTLNYLHIIFTDVFQGVKFICWVAQSFSVSSLRTFTAAGWWWRWREEATARGVVLTRIIITLQTLPLRHHPPLLPPRPALWPTTWSWSRSCSSWTRCPAWRGCGQPRSGVPNSWRDGLCMKRRCRTRSERLTRRHAMPTTSSRSSRGTCRLPPAWHFWRHRPGMIQMKVGAITNIIEGEV